MSPNRGGDDVIKHYRTFEVMDAHLPQEVELQPPLRK
jgi:hypothetical protein